MISAYLLVDLLEETILPIHFLKNWRVILDEVNDPAANTNEGALRRSRHGHKQPLKELSRLSDVALVEQ